jgi:hypothetical protein
MYARQVLGMEGVLEKAKGPFPRVAALAQEKEEEGQQEQAQEPDEQERKKKRRRRRLGIPPQQQTHRVQCSLRDAADRPADSAFADSAFANRIQFADYCKFSGINDRLAVVGRAVATLYFETLDAYTNHSRALEVYRYIYSAIFRDARRTSIYGSWAMAHSCVV